MERNLLYGGLAYVISFCLILTVLFVSGLSQAGEPTEEQKLRWGLKEKKTFTQCRLAARKVYNETKFCIYRGANGTYEQLSVPRFEQCPNQFQCVYAPRVEENSIQAIIEKLERNMR